VSDDDGFTIIPLGPSSGTASRTYERLPDWVSNLRPLAMLAGGAMGTLIAFANDPFGFIFEAISYYILGGLLAVIRLAAGAVLYPFDLLVGALQFIQETLVGAFAAIGIDILEVLAGIQQGLGNLIASAGPAAPVLAVGLASAGLFLTYRLAIAALELVPGGSSILTLGGLR
jgi:hypothetical protein